MSNSTDQEEPRMEFINSVIPGVQIECNIPQIAEQLFSSPAREPFTVDIELETENVENRSPEQAQTIFEVLAHILLYGIRVKYGEDQDPRRLNETQINDLNKYMRSFGFNVVLNTYSVEETMDDPEGYAQTDIEFYRLRMIDPDINVWHDIKIESYKYTQPIAHGARLL